MVSPFIRVSTGLCCCLILGAQAPAPASGVIAGLVLDGATRQPIRRAIVTLSTVDAHPQDAVAWTDANGRFAFGYLPTGRYEIHVTKTGYLAAAYGSDSLRRPPGVISLAAGEVRNDLLFRLRVESSISGTVTDGDGDPLANIQILAMRPGWQRGQRQFIGAGGVGSDRNGRYRLNLPEGTYLVMAQQQGRPLPIRAEASAGETPPPYGYVPQYYPGTDRVESATLLKVEPGQEYTEIDFHLRVQPQVALQGKIVPPPQAGPAEQLTLTAVRDEEGNRPIRGEAVIKDLTFRIDGLTPGSYVLTAQATIEGRRYRGVQRIETGSEGARDLAIPLEPSIDLSGTVSVDGPGAAKVLPSSVSLVPGDRLPFNGLPLRATVGPDGAFTIQGVPPGVWDINVNPLGPEAYLKSMRLGDQDVLTEEMAIQSSTRAPLKIVIGTPPASIQGEVSKDGQPARAAVLLAPEAKFRHVMSFYRSVIADAAGHFEIKNARPGTYRLFAFDEFDPQSIQDPEFLKPFEQEGATVALREGQAASQKLTVIQGTGPQSAITGEAR